ncbi:MAG: VWA domain-containing protein [Chloroflexota bacterium]
MQVKHIQRLVRSTITILILLGLGQPLFMTAQAASDQVDIAQSTSAPTDVPTETPVNTATEAPTETPANTETPTVAPTDTPDSTNTPTAIPTDTPDSTSTPTALPTDTPDSTSTPTVAPTETLANTETPTQVPTETATALPSETPSITPTSTSTSTPTQVPSIVPVAFSCESQYYYGSGQFAVDYDQNVVVLGVSQGQIIGTDRSITYVASSFLNLTGGTNYQLQIPVSSVSNWAGYSFDVLIDGIVVHTEDNFVTGSYLSDAFVYPAGASIEIKFYSGVWSAATINLPIDLGICPATPTPTPTFTPSPTPWILPTYTPPDNPFLTCRELDMVYLLDNSGSMSWDYNGAPKIEYAKDAIQLTNNWLFSFGYLEDVSGALVTFNNTGQLVSNYIDFQEGDDVNQFNTIVEGITAAGATNMAQGLQISKGLADDSAATSNAETRLIILLSDGAPTMDLAGNFNAATALADAQAQVDIIANQTDARIFSVAIFGDSFDDRILTYATNSTGGGYASVADLNNLQATIQSYLEDVCDFVDLSVDLEMSPNPEVQLEERAEYNVFVTSQLSPPASPNLYKSTTNVAITISLNTLDELDPTLFPVGSKNLDYINFENTGAEWECVALSNIEARCALRPGFTLPPNGIPIQVTTISARVPGRYYPENIFGRAELSTTFSEINAADDLDTDMLDVKKAWVFNSSELQLLESYTHVKFDPSLQVQELEHDYRPSDLVVNPLQVPIQVSFGAHFGDYDPSYPKLIAEYCFDKDVLDAAPIPTPQAPLIPPFPEPLKNLPANIPIGSCGVTDVVGGTYIIDYETNDDHYFEGSLYATDYSVTTIDFYESDRSGNISFEYTLPLAAPIDVELGDRANGKLGRYLGEEPVTCAFFDENVRSGGCIDFFDDYTPYTIATFPEYMWVNSEYFGLILMTTGGSPDTCATSSAVTAPYCVEDLDAKPGYYQFGGRIYGDTLFYDPIRLKSQPDNIVAFEFNDVDPTVDDDGLGLMISGNMRAIAPFIEQE